MLFVICSENTKKCQILSNFIQTPAYFYMFYARHSNIQYILAIDKLSDIPHLSVSAWF